MDGDPRMRVVLSDDAKDGLYQLRIGLARAAIHLEFAHDGKAPGDQVQYLGKRGNGLTVPGIGCLERGKGQRADGAGEVRGSIDREVVHQDRDAIGAELDVDLHRVCSVERLPHARQGIGRGFAGCCCMADDKRGHMGPAYLPRPGEGSREAKNGPPGWRAVSIRPMGGFGLLPASGDRHSAGGTSSTDQGHADEQPAERRRIAFDHAVAGIRGLGKRSGGGDSARIRLTVCGLGRWPQRAQQIRVNCICPGTVDTPFVEGYLEKYHKHEKEKVRAELNARQPIGRLGKPEEIAYMALYLCSPFGATISGQALAVDGDIQRLG